ncbi:MAG: RNA polymerase sigma factor [Anaerovoracaceae bacterium]|nr:RNA polymerase sigma factor [Bacillota bacterium]MDY2669946.1 RNA polymerase sigma factor [Anaerovoracaceae bacterium]
MDAAKIFNEYYKDIYRFALALTKSHYEAEEIAQETFVKAIASADSFDGSKDIRAWLFAIARNTFTSRYRKSKKFVKQELDKNLEDKESVDFVQVIADKEKVLKIHQFIHGMREPYKEVFYLRVFGELNFSQIGNVFEKSSNWARLIYYRAKLQIQKYIEENESES